MHFDDASKALVELATSRHNAFHSSEVADFMSARRLRRAELRGELKRLHPRIWSVSALGPSPGQRIRAATLWIAGSAACHLTAAALNGWIELSTEHRPAVWVPETAASSKPGIDLHRCQRIDPARDVCDVDGIRALNPAATLCLLGRVAPRSLVDRCLDEFSRSHSMQWLESTLDRLWSPTCRGTATLTQVLTDPRRTATATDSWMERLLADLLNRPELPPLVTQHVVEIDDRRYRIDVAFPDIKLGIEAHSRRFHWGPGSVDADNVRDLALSTVGWQLLYVTWSQLSNRQALVEHVVKTAMARSTLCETGQR